MKYLKRFNENTEDTIKSNGTISANIDTKSDSNHTIYDKRWQEQLSEYLTINYHGKLFKFKKDNIMLHSDMIQITYSSTPIDGQESGEIWGSPDTLEFDIYFAKEDNKIILNVDITYGDLMACEFSIEEPNIVNVIEYTSYGSKFDPSDTVFALTDESLEKFINFLNKFPGVKISKDDMKFLDQYRDWLPK